MHPFPMGARTAAAVLAAQCGAKVVVMGRRQDRADRVDRVRLGGGLVVAVALQAREAQRDPARVLRAGLHAVEGDLDDELGADVDGVGVAKRRHALCAKLFADLTKQVGLYFRADDVERRHVWRLHLEHLQEMQSVDRGHRSTPSPNERLADDVLEIDEEAVTPGLVGGA